MARSKTPLQINLEYTFVRGLFGLLRILPLRFSLALSRGLMQLILWIVPKRRRIMEDNIAACFPEKSAAQRAAIAREAVDTVAKGVAYFPQLPDLFAQKSTPWIELVGNEHAQAGLKKGKGVLFFTAHYGFWEAMALTFQRFSGAIHSIARPLDNPKVDQLITAVRQSNGARVVIQHQVLKEGLRALRKNQIVGFLIDQNFYKGGVFVDFFGRPAASTTIVSLLARRSGAEVLPVHSEWHGKKLRVIIHPPIELSKNADPNLAAAEDTQQMAKIMEGWIRKIPGQWLWLHNRWKRKPQEGDFVYSGEKV